MHISTLSISLSLSLFLSLSLSLSLSLYIYIYIYVIPHPVASEYRRLVNAPPRIRCPRCLRQVGGRIVVVAMTIAESPRRHKRVTFVNIAPMASPSINHRHKLDYGGVIHAHQATGVFYIRQTPWGWIQIGECHTRGVGGIPLGLKPSRDSHATSAAFTNLNPAHRDFSRWYIYNQYIYIYMYIYIWWYFHWSCNRDRRRTPY